MVDHSPSNPSDFHANFCKMKYGENRCTCGYTQVYAVPDVSPVRCVNHDYYSDTYCPWCRAENAEQRLAEANEALRRWEGSCTDAMADNRWLRAALESIIHHAPGTWQADEAREALRPSADASKTPSHVSVTAGTSAVAGFCNPTQDGRPSAESTETVPNADKVAFSRLWADLERIAAIAADTSMAHEDRVYAIADVSRSSLAGGGSPKRDTEATQAMSCDSAQDDRARPADETHKASAELKDRAANELRELRAAGLALYMAGCWALPRSEMHQDAMSKLWENLRDALGLGLAPGAATAAGVRAAVETSAPPVIHEWCPKCSRHHPLSNMCPP